MFFILFCFYIDASDRFFITLINNLTKSRKIMELKNKQNKDKMKKKVEAKTRTKQNKLKWKKPSTRFNLLSVTVQNVWLQKENHSYKDIITTLCRKSKWEKEL